MATKPPKWRNSKEKDILYKDITKGNVAGMAPILVYGMHDGIYHKFKYKNFRNNLLRLRKSVADNEERASAAKAAYDHDKQVSLGVAQRLKKCCERTLQVAMFQKTLIQCKLGCRV